MSNYSGPIFDAHVHTEFATAGDLETFKALKSRFDIRASITDSHAPACNTQTLQTLGVGRCAVIAKPDWCHDSLVQGLVSGVYVAIKINLGFMPVYADDPRLMRLYSLAHEFNVPVLLHTGDTGWHRSKLKYAHPLSMDEVIVDHPQVSFLLVHSGNPWFTDAAVVAAKNNNVWLDISSIVEGPLSQVSPAKLDKLMIQPIRWMLDYTDKPDRLIFGSGWPSVDYPHYVAACAKAIDPQCHSQVFFENATKFFKVIKD
ncbi:amidohydrolase family protein [Pseudomonas sp. CFBP 13711]|uniref:amidohydrolase family protein n=1 Tax=unclassified Pseudomonas TaxID=196821 RepID=UPI00177F169C|nr:MULTISPECIES: amidohydrolase family protein [unclassified Pseudomonas]MBD8706058.1 amidohydrolase family protein [Pseudomonas sp. CFBP 13711]MBD8711956.1 amidohydrolase family protein [Pseudomonas sp. CFBP 13715]